MAAKKKVQVTVEVEEGQEVVIKPLAEALASSVRLSSNLDATGTATGTGTGSPGGDADADVDVDW